MVPSYSEYIRRYIDRRTTTSPPCPGEHHFVATYLLPKLYELNTVVPDYVNPDGTKSVIGDIVYYRDDRHYFGIEVKLGTVRLTKREFNEWIVRNDPTRWPNLFLGVGRKGVVLAPWSDFRSSYVSPVKEKKIGWTATEISDGYGPMKAVDELEEHVPEDQWFPLAELPATAASELLFTTALRCRIKV